jgi:ring-1,2-phenylacetyl-CoA epoxidase subunit PaaD
MVALGAASLRSSRAKSEGAGTESEPRASTEFIQSAAAGGVEGLGTNEAVDHLWAVLREVADPEIPVISVVDLGIVRDILAALDAAGYPRVRIETVLSPPWTTDWISEAGKAKLRAYGIAPPRGRGERAVECPQCGSSQTEEISRFGSTPCKAQWRCRDCLEPFDLFKCH